MDLPDPPHARLVGDYILGQRIGSGSFAVVWRARHRQSGLEVAVKEIDDKLLSPKVRDNLLKEISILSTINHPNIIRLFESIKVIMFTLFILMFIWARCVFERRTCYYFYVMTILLSVGVFCYSILLSAD